MGIAQSQYDREVIVTGVAVTGNRAVSFDVVVVFVVVVVLLVFMLVSAVEKECLCDDSCARTS